jgi:hypothetical protein
VRVLIWGIVLVLGLAGAVAAISVHGSADERAAIRHALRAPLLDLRRRDARRLCGDFTVAAEAHIAPGAGSCHSRLAEDFRLARAAAIYPRTDATALASGLQVTGISWHDDRATATSSYAGDPASARHWRLQRVGEAWRIATPATLQMQADCRRPEPAKRDCAYALSLRFDSGA